MVPFNPTLNEEAFVDISNQEFDTIGFPIIFPIELNIPPANLMLLHITAPKEINSTDILIQSKVEINTDTAKPFFTVTVLTDKIPSSITLEFSLSSLFPVVHKLKKVRKTLSFARSKVTPTSPPALTV